MRARTHPGAVVMGGQQSEWVTVVRGDVEG